jgi:hypothetical protein
MSDEANSTQGYEKRFERISSSKGRAACAEAQPLSLDESHKLSFMNESGQWTEIEICEIFF